MTGYKIATAVRGEVTFSDLGGVPFEFEAGVATPKDELEAAVLAHLAAEGLVEVVVEKPKAKPAKSEPVTEEQE